MSEKADPEEARAFLDAHPDLDAIDLLIFDLNGLCRGKRVHPDALLNAYRNGISLAKSLIASDITGATADDAELGFEIGDLDCEYRPIPGSLCMAPWHERSMAQAQLAMFDTGSQPYLGDPHHIAGDIVARFADLGLTPVVAIEMEFYLIDRQRTADNKPQPAISPVTGERQRHTQVYSITDLDDYGDFLTEVGDAAAVQSLPADTAVAEYAPGQYEINLLHQPDAQAACRHGLMLKRLIKGVALKHGMEATFMPRPFYELVGSGTHVHVSLLDERGRNIFAGGETPNDALRHAIGGLAATMAETVLLCAPNANSYRRFVADSYVPLTLTWGMNNRTVALRIPTGSPDATRIEHRVAGADANPYLLTAVVLAGMHYGLTGKIEPPEITTGNAYEQQHPDLPDTWKEALASFAQGQVIPDYLGPEFCRIYAAIKQQEYDRFKRVITPLEYDWYLRTS